MSEYAFKNLNEIDTVVEPADGTTVMGFEDGEPIQMPMSAIKGAVRGVFLINPNADDYNNDDPKYGNRIKEALLAGMQIWVLDSSATTTTASSTNKYVYNLVYRFRTEAVGTGGKGRLTIFYLSSINTEYAPTLAEMSFTINV